MAPEQAEAKPGTVGPAVDVYALGAILYELLTGRPPFQGETTLETLDQLRNQEPVAPRQLQPKLPRDVETVCLKALARAPGRRYATSEALADDLRRFLDGRPIQARPVGRVEKTWRWCRRNPRVAGLAAAVVVLLVGVTAASVWAAVEANGREQARKRDVLVQKIELLRLRTHVNGWSRLAWAWVEQAADIRLEDPEHRLQQAAVATLAGLDARVIQRFESETRYEHDATSVAFSPDGKWLLMGGANDREGEPLKPARLWEWGALEPRKSEQKGAGPVAFRKDGTPVQLVPQHNPPSILLWDVANQRPLSVFRFAEQPRVDQLARNALRFAVTALSSDGSRAAAAAAGPNAKGIVAVWDAATGKLLGQVEADAHALTFSPDNSLLAVGDQKGQIVVWSVAGRKPVATLPGRGLTLHCLAFSPDGKRLAAGGAGGTLTIWDWPQQRLLCSCHGSVHDVYAVAFNPDGSLLVSGGRSSYCKFWDAATGRPLLDFDSGSLIMGLALSPDGRMLASSGITGFSPGTVYVWGLEYGRGIHTLHGLTAPIAKMRFSPDGERLAALAQNWQVAIWNLRTGRLERVLDVPQGLVADNAALAFSPDGQRFAFAAGKEAKAWDLSTGEARGAWQLPRLGLKDALAFHPSNRLFLLREELKDRDEYPGKYFDPKRPRVGPLRELIGRDQVREVKVINQFSRFVHETMASGDGSIFLVDGYHIGVNGEGASIRAFDARTGEERWAVRTSNTLDDYSHRTFVPDPTGHLVSIQLEQKTMQGNLVDVATGRIQAPLKILPQSLGPQGELLLGNDPVEDARERPGYALFRRGGDRLLTGLGRIADPTWHGSDPQFSRSDGLLAWGNTDGTVFVFDLAGIRKQLSQVGLGW